LIECWPTEGSPPRQSFLVFPPRLCFRSSGLRPSTVSLRSLFESVGPFAWAPALLTFVLPITPFDRRARTKSVLMGFAVFRLPPFPRAPVTSYTPRSGTSLSIGWLSPLVRCEVFPLSSGQLFFSGPSQSLFFPGPGSFSRPQTPLVLPPLEDFLFFCGLPRVFFSLFFHWWPLPPLWFPPRFFPGLPPGSPPYRDDCLLVSFL